MKSQNKTPRRAKSPSSRKIRGWGRSEGDRSRAALPCDGSDANSWSAGSLRSPPLERRWPGGAPASQERTRAGLSEQWTGARRRPPRRQRAFRRACPGLLSWEVKHAKARGRRRQPRERSGPGRAGGRGEPAVGTVPRPAPPGPRLSRALTASSHSHSWLLEGTRGRAAGRGAREEGGTQRSRGASAPQLRTLQGSQVWFPKTRTKTTPPPREASSPSRPPLGSPDPLPLKCACANLGFIRLNSMWFSGRPHPIELEVGKYRGCSPRVGLRFAPGGGAEAFRAFYRN